MPTVGERLATLETLVRSSNEKLDDICDLVNGGGDTEYDRSVRGRLHKIETTLAGMVLRRNFGVGLLKGWERFVLVACAAATVAASWYAALGH
jgi:hypothetical protein